MPQAPLPLATAAVGIPSTEDADALAELMLDAYRGTIDYDSSGACTRSFAPKARLRGPSDGATFVTEGM